MRNMIFSVVLWLMSVLIPAKTMYLKRLVILVWGKQNFRPRLLPNCKVPERKAVSGKDSVLFLIRLSLAPPRGLSDRCDAPIHRNHAERYVVMSLVINVSPCFRVGFDKIQERVVPGKDSQPSDEDHHDNTPSPPKTSSRRKSKVNINFFFNFGC